jgi:dipeptidyl aminopeptidase/acylaminoacyl peptidase
MKNSLPVLSLVSALLVVAHTGLAKPVGEFEEQGDVGAPKLAGSASYDEARQEYTFKAAGANMWAARDEFQFAWKKTNGDFIVRTRVEFVGPGVDPHRKAGWIARTSLEADATYIDGARHAGDGLTSLQFRRTKGGATEEIRLPIKWADVLQLERRGKTYIFSAAIYGEPFVSAQIADLDLGAEPLVGLFLSSHNADVQETAVFRDVRFTKPVKMGFTPYKDYIGSKLEILDVHSGKLETIYQSKEPFEAPNWTTDGRSLIYNVSGAGPNKGRLSRFDLATRTPQPLDTGDVNRSNNDHVLSFDGKMLGISSSGPGTFRSRVWVLPSTGGAPKLITPLAPSYLHGWSPDGKFLVYTGGRKDPSNPTGPDKLDIYKVAVDGGEEVRLTTSKGMADGSEYAPDGKWIYYNSTDTGLMQLRRMRPDGSGQEAVTNDEFNNWFSHISPDGKWIAMISYAPDADPSDHPYYKHCYLRLMSTQGGPIKVIAYLYGGQGTINVPSWSPDSRKIAFVSNADF